MLLAWHIFTEIHMQVIFLKEYTWVVRFLISCMSENVLVLPLHLIDN